MRWQPDWRTCLAPTVPGAWPTREGAPRAGTLRRLRVSASEGPGIPVLLLLRGTGIQQPLVGNRNGLQRYDPGRKEHANSRGLGLERRDEPPDAPSPGRSLHQGPGPHPGLRGPPQERDRGPEPRGPTRSLFRTLPEAVSGSSSTSSMDLGILYGGHPISPERKPFPSMVSSSLSRRKARPHRPLRGSGTPTTAASKILECSAKYSPPPIPGMEPPVPESLLGRAGVVQNDIMHMGLRTTISPISPGCTDLPVVPEVYMIIWGEA